MPDKEAKEAKLVIVEPVEGFYLNDVPAVRQEVTPKRAEELVATGAFKVVKE
jgi:hypothetical protein